MRLIPPEPLVRVGLEEFNPLDKKWGVSLGPNHHGRRKVIAVEHHRTLGPISKGKIVHYYGLGGFLPTLLHFVPLRQRGRR